MMWRPSKIGAEILAYVIERWQHGSQIGPTGIAISRKSKTVHVRAVLAALIKHGYARYDTAPGAGLQVVVPLRYTDGREIEGVSPLAGCRVEKRADLPVPVTICPPRHAVGETFRQRLSKGGSFGKGRAA